MDKKFNHKEMLKHKTSISILFHYFIIILFFPHLFIYSFIYLHIYLYTFLQDWDGIRICNP